MTFVVNGQAWRVVRVAPGDPRLVDRTGREKLATTDPLTRTVHISSEVRPPLLDQVALHEAAHVASMANGTLARLRAVLPPECWIDAEEWAAQEVELNGIEAADIATRMLGRPVCVRGHCHD